MIIVNFRPIIAVCATSLIFIATGCVRCSESEPNTSESESESPPTNSKTEEESDLKASQQLVPVVPAEAISQDHPPSKKDVKIEVLKPGKGAILVQPGKKLAVHYNAKFEDGRVFDSSEDRGSPFSFIIGASQVMPGWEIGVEGMKIGERRKIWIPARLAFGAKGVNGIIEPNQNLVYEIELLSVD